MTHVEAVPRAGEIRVEALVLLEAIVRDVVDALERQRRPQVIAFTGMVVDDVEDHFDPRRVKRLHHRLELIHLIAESTRGVADVGREEADRVIAPIIR